MTDGRTLGHIALDKIRPNQVALRTVQKDSEKFLAMVDSIRLPKGNVINPVSVVSKEEEGVQFYELVDGLHRYTASIEAGRDTIPAIVLEATETEVHIAQIVGNIHKMETKPHQYANQLKLILSSRPEMSLSDLAGMVAMSVGWVRARMSLTKLPDDLGLLVDSGDISLSNAYELAKLPADEQMNYSAQAQTMEPKEFFDLVSQRLKEVNAAKRKGQKPGPAQFEPKAHLRKKGEVTSEFEAGLPTVRALVAGKTAEDAAKVTFEWLLHLDEASVTVARATFEQATAEREAKAKAKKAERAEKMRKEADALVA